MRFHRYFHVAVIGVIILNSLLLVASALDEDHRELWENVENGCLLFFCVELAVRLHSHGFKGFLRSAWCWFDSVVIVLALLPMMGVDVSVLRVARIARLLHFGRHVTHLRAVGLVARSVRAGRLASRAGRFGRRWL